MAHILREAGTPLPEALFPLHASVDSEALRKLLRLIVGREDFARHNGHYMRRDICQDLVKPFDRICLHCWRVHGHRVLDSEWHALLSCPLHEAARQRFRLQTNSRTYLGCTVACLAKLVLKARTDSQILNALGRLTFDVLRCRERWHRSPAARASAPAASAS